MKFSFTNHAKYRLMERGISVDLVKIAILKPDKYFLEKSGLVRVRKKFNHKNIQVVYRLSKGKYVIITAYYEN